MFNRYPYSDAHELNLDMILDMMKKLHHEWDDFTAVNKITNAGAWDITKQYQPWTVVSDNNVGYISLKPVPVGVAISNIEYWGLIADYDILITDLSNRISILEGQMSTLNNTTIPALDAEIEALKIDARRFISPDDFILFVGDSYGTIITPTWVENCANVLGITNTQYKNACVSGAGFAQTTSFLDILSDASNLALAAKVTKIVICGGINDSYDTLLSGLDAAIQSTITYAKTNYPKANIYVGYIGTTFSNVTNAPGGINNRDQQLEALTKYQLGSGYCYLNGVENFIRVRNDLLWTDHIHPDVLGLVFIGVGVAKALMNGCASISQGKFATSGQKYSHFMINDTTYVTLKSANFTISGTINSGDSITLASNTGVYVDKPFKFISEAVIFNGAVIPIFVQYTLNEYTLTATFISVDGASQIATNATLFISQEEVFRIPTFYCN